MASVGLNTLFTVNNCWNIFQNIAGFNHMTQSFTRISFMLVKIKVNTIGYGFPFYQIQATEGKI